MLKRQAIRRRIWYNALSIHERMLISLVSKYIKQIRNVQLAIVLSRIIIRLKLLVDVNARVLVYGYSKAHTWLKTMIYMGWYIYSLDKYDGIIQWFALININR